MATVTANNPSGIQGTDAYLITWEAMGNDDEGSAVQMAGYADRSIQIVGTLGGALVTIQGSLDGVNWETLNDVFGNPLTYNNTSGLDAIAELVAYIRPVTSGGSGSDIDVTLLVKRGFMPVRH